MELKFISQIRKGNNRGTGFICLPKGKADSLILDDWVRTELSENIYFLSKIISYSHRQGVYVPKNIVVENNLLNKKTKIQIKKIDGFYAPVGSDGRVYIPYDVVKSESLHRNKIVSIKAMDNNKVIQEKYVKIYVSRRPERKREEFICYVDKNLSGRTLVFQIEKLSRIPQNGEMDPIVTKLLQGTHYAFIGKNSVIIFKGNKVPAIINTSLKLLEIAFYIGAYFADGTKKGNSWAICASTFEQAKYYLKIHNLLIKDSKPEFTISYTNIYNIDHNNLKRDLAKIWQKEVSIKVNKFRIRKPTGKSITKWNKYGTLIIREHRQILLDIYNALIESLINEILFRKDKKLAIDFICGVMEGDGCASATKRGHVMIFANKDDTQPLEKILKVAQIKFKVNKEGKNKYSLRIGALEILRNFCLLKDKIFILYPKRRKNLFERLKTVGAIKFLAGNHQPTSWVKSWLKNNGFCDKNYKITGSGLNVSNVILKEIQKAGVK